MEDLEKLLTKERPVLLGTVFLDDIGDITISILVMSPSLCTCRDMDKSRKRHR